MRNQQENTSAEAALLRITSGVDTPETNSLCCAAAGIIAPSNAPGETLIPLEKLRRAAHAAARLNAQERPLAQPAVGYTYAPGTIELPPKESTRRSYGPTALMGRAE